MKRIIVAFSILIMALVSHAQTPYDGLPFTSEIMESYHTELKPIYIKILEDAWKAEDENKSLGNIIDRFNDAFYKYTKPFKLNKNASSKTIFSVLPDIQTGFIEEKTHEKKSEADAMINSLFVDNAIMYLDNEGGNRVNEMMNDFFKPLIMALKVKLDDASIDEDVLGYVIIEANIWFDRVVGYSCDITSNALNVRKYLNISEAALKENFLKREQERLKRKK